MSENLTEQLARLEQVISGFEQELKDTERDYRRRVDGLSAQLDDLREQRIELRRKGA